MIFGQPSPLQPDDTTDKVIGMSVLVLGPGFDQCDEVEFECATCHKSYWRKVFQQEHFTEVVEVEGVEVNGKPAQYALNPTLVSFYGPRFHECG